ncbi:MAG: hypothetical protein RLZZ45_697 [Bacteroidota bacterium]|jgi:hypothetical protein
MAGVDCPLKITKKQNKRCLLQPDLSGLNAQKQ